MSHWNQWKEKNEKYVVWYRKEPSQAFSLLWKLLEHKFMELIPPSNGEQILLDVGCGDGRYLLSSAINKGYLSIGIDPNLEASLIPAKKKIKHAKITPFLVKSVGESLPLKTNSVSIALCNSALDHTLEPKSVLLEIHRTLKKEGFLVLWQGIYEQKHSEHDTHLRTFTKDSIATLLADCGFKVEKKKFLGFNYLPSSESYESASLKIPYQFNRFLNPMLELYLTIGKVIPIFASIAMLRTKKK
jgi:ubiquinone/menaquinone biosynthesis C-methylase UbiE